MQRAGLILRFVGEKFVVAVCGLVAYLHFASIPKWNQDWLGGIWGAVAAIIVGLFFFQDAIQVLRRLIGISRAKRNRLAPIRRG